MSSPNTFAYLMLCLWPVITWMLWTRLDPARALIWTIVGGYLFLPPVQAAFLLPGIPDLNKFTIPNLMAMACAMFMRKDRISLVPDSLLGRVLVVVFVFVPLGTVLTNADPMVGPGAYVPGMRIYDFVALVAAQVITLLPFFLGRHYLGAPEAMRAFAVALVTGGLFYSLPLLAEARLSPQLNLWVYGFFQHDFIQTIRFGGFRPMVFLPHGLWLAFFMLMTFVAAVALARRDVSGRAKWTAAALYLGAMLVLCRSVGPWVYAAAMVPLVILTPPRVQLIVAGLLAIPVVCYPLLRGAHLVPLDSIIELASQASRDRADSLAFRVRNEEVLLARAMERPWFGWGGYGRNLIIDMRTGRPLTISDGQWIIVLGIYGWFMYLAKFGLLTLPLVQLGRRAFSSDESTASPFVALVALLLAFNVVDLLPNDTLIPITWLMAGALFGHVEGRFASPTVAPSTPQKTVKRTIL